MSSPSGSPLPTRRDARRNRDLLLGCARAAFAERGADASLEQIARAAGLAIGTLYRHFPTRLDLLVAAIEPRMDQLFIDAEAALAEADPWEAFRSYIDLLCRNQADDRGFSDFTSLRFPNNERTEAWLNRICHIAQDVLDRTQQAGVVRMDATMTDIFTLLWANARVTEATGRIAPVVWRRHLHLVLGGFRPGDRNELPEPPLSAEQLHRAIAQPRE
ncbi:TetR/AcrR family transcriptional regulator [Streptomyces sp. GMY02]|uniref:TetR/AcrR family transcriptional regulator n=1 Tax=Streptomyces sp. GMY02 TaxID=1333528 RepID=UPI001C2BF43A|nr:TetR/AcrR family transcriptional regulator [Streptomyces sp. GMY02]QXE33856.1 TetR/AcrR family transcriptional regulator [Streptomyces sp. GMY02]